MKTASNKVHVSPPRVLQTPTSRTQTPHLIPIEPEETAPQQNPRQCFDSPPTTPRQHKYNTRLNVSKHGVNSLVEKDLGKSLEYRQLIQHPKHQQVWSKSMSNELGRFTQGNGRVGETNTMFFIPYEDIPHDRRKDVTYAKIVVDYRPHKQEKERTRLTVGENLINYPENVSAKTAEITTAKILINSTISTALDI